MEEYKAIMELLRAIDKKVDVLAAHSEYTKKGVQDNKDAIEGLKVDIAQNASEINTINEWKKALDKIIWEILKPPLKFIGLAGFVILAVVGGWLVLK